MFKKVKLTNCTNQALGVNPHWTVYVQSFSLKHYNMELIYTVD